MSNYYDILGINKDASDADIKKAYRKLAKKYHPDKNQGDTAAKIKFQEVQEAYDTLSDKDKKAKYDRPEPTYNTKTGSWGNYRSGSYSTSFDFEDYSSIFDNMYGGSWHHKGKSAKIDLEVTLEEAYSGTVKTVYATDPVPINIDIKPGIRNTYRVIVPGKGHRGSIENGDLYVDVHIAPHAKFTRKDNDLYCTLDIDLYTAVLGGEAFLDTFAGTVKITIPEGSQNGKIMRIPGKGMPILTNPDKKGDLFFELKVLIPTKLKEGEKDLFRMLRDFGNT